MKKSPQTKSGTPKKVVERANNQSGLASAGANKIDAWQPGDENKPARAGLWLRWGIVFILVLVPFHALFTTWLGSNFGYIDVFRIWKELLLFVFCLIAGYQLIKRPTLISELWNDWLFRIILIYLALTILRTLYGLSAGVVNAEAAIYGLIVNTRLMAFFTVVYISVRSGVSMRDWRKIVFIPAALVLAFGLMQYALPADFLRHFGYGPATIPAFQTVDNKLDFVRIQSFLRGPNPLGAYLVLILSLALAAALKSKKIWQYSLFGAAGLVVLYGTYSRSAWLGLAVAVTIVTYLSLRTARQRRLLLAAGITAGLIAVSSLIILRNNDTFQNIVFHTNEKSQSSTSSNESRAAALSNGWRDVLKNPLGGGVGSAGPASNRNTKRPAKISENYYLQIGQEVGWVGLLAFVAIYAMIALRLFTARRQVLALGLLGAMVGLSLINFLSHAWTDDTLAYLFWGLAGAAIAMSYAKPVVNKLTNGKLQK